MLLHGSVDFGGVDVGATALDEGIEQAVVPLLRVGMEDRSCPSP